MLDSGGRWERPARTRKRGIDWDNIYIAIEERLAMEPLRGPWLTNKESLPLPCALQRMAGDNATRYPFTAAREPGARKG